jgi:hypothetical protein
MNAAWSLMLARVRRGLGASLQWRLLVLWAAVLLVPTAIAALPLWATLDALLGHSPRAAELARHFDGLVFPEVAAALVARRDALSGSLLASLTAAWLLSPLCTGMAVAAARAGQPLGFAALVRGGVAEYGRMLCLLLVSLISLGFVGGLSAIVFANVGKHAEHATLDSEATAYATVATLFALVVFVVAHTTVEAGRALIAADPRPRSLFGVWWQGARLVFERPLAMLGSYVAVTSVSLLATLLLTFVRTHLIPAGGITFFFAFAVTQLLVAAIGWGRVARLFVLTALIRPEADSGQSQLDA